MTATPGDLKMDTIKLRYTASVFVDAFSIIPNAQNITELMNALGDEALLPMTLQEQSPAGLVPRIGFRTADGEWEFVLFSNQFRLIRSSKNPSGSNLGDFSTFCQTAIPKLTTTLNYFQRKPHRLAAVQEGFLSEMSQTEMDKIAKCLMNFPSMYLKQIPFNWNWQAVTLVEREFGGLKEITNTLTAVSRLAGYLTEMSDKEISQAYFDRILVKFDINTSENNIIARFDNTCVNSFFERASLWHSELSLEFLSFIFGESSNE